MMMMTVTARLKAPKEMEGTRGEKIWKKKDDNDDASNANGVDDYY